MSFCKSSITLLLLAAAITVVSRAAWLDKVVQYHKQKFFEEMQEMLPFEFSVDMIQKPYGYVDSKRWDFDAVVRLLNLIKTTESARHVHQALRRMLQPSRRLMMSMKESVKKFPSLKHDANEFYYDVEYTSVEEEKTPPSVAEEDVVVVVSNPVEARLPSARISVALLRQILEARAIAAREMPSTTKAPMPWTPMDQTIKHKNGAKTQPPSGNDTSAGGKEDGATTGAGGEEATTPGGDSDSTATVAGEPETTTVE